MNHLRLFRSNFRPAAPPRPGAVLLMVALLLPMILIFTAFVIDVGHILLKQSQLQTAVDAATLGAAMDFEHGEDAVHAMVDQMLALNGFDTGANSNIHVTTEFGTWDPAQRQFVPTSFDNARALRVEVLDESLPSFFGVMMGHTSYSVQANAVSGAGGRSPLDVVLVLDCSTSMRATMGNDRTRIENAREAAVRLVDGLSVEDRIGLTVFSWFDDGRNQNEKTGIVESWLRENHQPARNRLRELRAGEYVSRGLGTNVGGGLRAGLELYLNDVHPRSDPDVGDVEQIMILLTDGRVNLAEPYPIPDDGSDGIAPLPPFSQEYDPRESVRLWANTIKARGIKLFVVTVSDEAYDPLMVEIASPADENQDSYYFHVADGANDHLRLLEVFGEISSYGNAIKLLQ